MRLSCTIAVHGTLAANIIVLVHVRRCFRGTNDLSLCMHKLPLPAVDGRKSMLPWLFAVICFAIPDLAPIRAGEEFQALLPPSHISQLCPLSA